MSTPTIPISRIASGRLLTSAIDSAAATRVVISSQRKFHVLPSSVLGCVQLILSSAFLYTIFHVTYNLYFHPLASFPGPKLAAATRLYYLRYLLTGRLPFNNTKLHKQYGGIVRIAPNELSLNTAEGWKDVYGTRAGKPEMTKNALFYAAMSSGSASVIGSTRNRHGPLRRLVSHGFSERALREQEPLIQSYCDLLLQRLREHSKEGTELVDMVQWYNFFTFDVIGDLTFGESFGCLDAGEYHPWVSAIFDSVKSASFLRGVGYYPLLEKLMRRFIPKSLKEMRAKHAAMTVAKVQARQSRDSDRHDFLAGFLVDGADASNEEMVATARTLIIAGSETTATLLSGITYLLLKNPRVLEKLVDEVRSNFNAESEINLIGANKLTYMLVCLDEAMRMYPPVPGSFPRDIPSGGDRIGNLFIPEGTIVAVTQFATYHSETNFALPDEFIPERWLNDGDERFVNDNKAAFQPFSTGPRNCVGRNLAYLEMRIVLARLLWNLNLTKLGPQSEDWASQNVFLLWEKPELMVQLTPRIKI